MNEISVTFTLFVIVPVVIVLMSTLFGDYVWEYILGKKYKVGDEVEIRWPSKLPEELGNRSGIHAIIKEYQGRVGQYFYYVVDIPKYGITDYGINSSGFEKVRPHDYEIKNMPNNIFVGKQGKNKVSRGGASFMPRIVRVMLWLLAVSILYRLSDPLVIYITNLLHK